MRERERETNKLTEGETGQQTYSLKDSLTGIAEEVTRQASFCGAVARDQRPFHTEASKPMRIAFLVRIGKRSP